MRRVLSQTVLLLLVFSITAFSGGKFNVVTEIEEAQGFVSLFDGTFQGLNRHFVNYKQNDSGNVVLTADWKIDTALQAAYTEAAGYSDIRSVSQYRDFDFRFDYLNSGDGGFFYRFNLSQEAPWKTGVEFSIMDDEDNCLRCAGAAMDLYHPKPKVYLPYASGRWNQARIVVVGDSVEHWLNGSLVLGYRYHSVDFWARVDKGRWAGTPLTLKVPGNRWAGSIEQGYVGFQATVQGRWLVRNIRINAENPKLGPDKWWTLGVLPRDGLIAAGREGARSWSAGVRYGAWVLGIYGRAVTADGRVAR